jgi:hypothetical protein
MPYIDTKRAAGRRPGHVALGLPVIVNPTFCRPWTRPPGRMLLRNPKDGRFSASSGNAFDVRDAVGRCCMERGGWSALHLGRNLTPSTLGDESLIVGRARALVCPGAGAAPGRAAGFWAAQRSGRCQSSQRDM